MQQSYSFRTLHSAFYGLKSAQNMKIDEGGVPTGSLSDYVSGVLSQKAQQEVEAQRLKNLAAQAQLQQFIQRTAPLREYLLQLAAPLDELLARFRVRELLEEVQSEYWKDGTIRRKEHPIYRDIVSNPDPTDPGRNIVGIYKPGAWNGYDYWDMGLYPLNELLDPINFQRLIPRLQGYGLILEREFVGFVEEYRNASTQISSGSSFPDSSPTYRHYLTKTGRQTPVRVFRSMIVESVESDSGFEHDLIYSFVERYRGRDQVNGWSPNGDYYPKPIRIIAGQSTDVLKGLIGDQIAKQVKG